MDTRIIRADKSTIPIVLVGENNDPWFRANDVAEALGYTQPAVSVGKVLKKRCIKRFNDLLPDILSSEESMRSYDKRSFWMNEPGVYRMVGQSTLPAADAFQDWVYDHVLPTIRKTGSYTVQKPAEHAAATPWQQSRVDGIELCKLKNAGLHALLQHVAADPRDADRLYAVVGCAVNRAVLDTDMTKKELFRAKRLPGHMSVPDFLDFDGTLSRQYVERAFQAFLETHASRLRAQPLRDTVTELEELGGRMRAAAASTGHYAGLADRMMTPEEARRRKQELERGRRTGTIAPGAAVGLLKGTGGVVKKRPRQSLLTIAVRG
ncbi:hypothetical protein WJX74_002321 [Apatococcus lobatus]|uniref:Bro-N domain-containing protein n=1 Tax=Apatococcus lobatus TaxID=904363 RepID=A0AAW1Q2S7_9CHLO